MVNTGCHQRDRWWLVLLALVCIFAGLGLRGPWAPDEPRFALAAKEMVESGQWFFPRLLGNLYADKPPLFMWAIAVGYATLGSLSVAFLLPSMLAGLISLLLWHDIAGRLGGRQRARYVTLALLISAQFFWQVRFAQIDAFLFLWTSIGFYGLLRHLLLGPSWCWWCLAWLAMGCGVISKGVGFLPALMLLPWAWLRWRGGGGLSRIHWTWGGGLAPLLLFVPVLAWLLPMLVLVAQSGDPALVAYRDNILFHQTAQRYINAGHHYHWFGYYVIEVAPVLWLPMTLLLPWTSRPFLRRLRRGDPLVVLSLASVALILLFFSFSPSKRGVYILPALPLFVLAHLGFVRALLRQPQLQKAIAVGLSALAGLFFLLVLIGPWLLHRPLARVAREYGYDPLPEVWLLAVLTVPVALLAWCLRRRGLAPLAAVAQGIGVILVIGLALWPKLDSGRSGRLFMQSVGERLAPDTVIGLVHWKERFGLYDGHPLRTWGYRRDDTEQEGQEALAWMREDPQRRVVFMPISEDQHWYDGLLAIELGRYNRANWRLCYLSPAALANGVQNSLEADGVAPTQGGQNCLPRIPPVQIVPDPADKLNRSLRTTIKQLTNQVRHASSFVALGFRYRLFVPSSASCILTLVDDAFVIRESTFEDGQQVMRQADELGMNGLGVIR